MARDGNGKYNIPTNSWYPPVNGNQATAADFKKLIEDVADSLTQSVSSDGQTAMQGSLNMGGNRVRSLGAPQGNNDALRRLQLMKGPDITPETVSTIPDEGNFFEMNGKGTVQSFSTSFPGRQAWIRFSDEITLKNSTALQLPNNKDWATTNGHFGLFLQTNDDNWMCVGRWPVVIPTGTAADANLVTSQTDKTAGRVLTTGYGGLLGGMPVPGNDLNNAMLPGFYSWKAEPIANAPPGITQRGSMIVTSWGSGDGETCEQVVFKSGLIRVRGKNNLSTAWSPWVEVYTSGNFNPASKADTTAAVASFTGDFPWNRVSEKPATATRWPTWDEVSSKPATFAPSSHTHAWAQVTGAPATATRWPTWAEVTSKPTAFPPASHSHAWGEISGKPATFPPVIGTAANQAKAGNWAPDWSEVRNKPAIPPAPQATQSKAVGSYCVLRNNHNTTSTTIADNEVVAGSNLMAYFGPPNTSSLPGTWRNVSGNMLQNKNTTASNFGIFVRVT